jgi:predicted RNA binding protein YcfA (HicA-like mRNA interferase family)
MSKSVTLQQFQQTLRGFGFEQSKRSGHHLIYQHPTRGVIVTVPTNEPNIRPVYVRAAAKQVANSGIATTQAFEAKLNQGAKKAGGHR